MGIYREVIASGIIITAFLFCQFLSTTYSDQNTHNNVTVELTGSMS